MAGEGVGAALLQVIGQFQPAKRQMGERVGPVLVPCPEEAEGQGGAGAIRGAEGGTAAGFVVGMGIVRPVRD